MSISQQSKPESGPNKLGWKAAFDPGPTGVTSALQLDCFQLRFSLGGFTSSYNWNCPSGIYSGFKSRKVGPPKKLSAKPNKRLFSESLRAAALQLLWYRMTKSSNFRAFVLCARRLLGPPCAVTSHRRWLYIEAATAHIPSDHSCVWHFKEDYENEMW